MTGATANFWDSLSKDEGGLTHALMDDFANLGWAKSIIDGINDNGGVARENKDRLFELRFANALHRVGVLPKYEIPGVGSPTIDFGFVSQARDGAVELLQLGETQAAKQRRRILSTTAAYRGAKGFYRVRLKIGHNRPREKPSRPSKGYVKNANAMVVRTSSVPQGQLIMCFWLISERS